MHDRYAGHLNCPQAMRIAQLRAVREPGSVCSLALLVFLEQLTPEKSLGCKEEQQF